LSDLVSFFGLGISAEYLTAVSTVLLLEDLASETVVGKLAASRDSVGVDSDMLGD